MRHRELDRLDADLGRPRGGTAAEVDTRLRPPAQLDLLPREVDTRAERLADCLLRREPSCVVLRRVRLRVAVRDLRCGEASLLEGGAVAFEGTPDPLDLDQVDPDAEQA